MTQTYEAQLNDWIQEEKKAIELTKIVGGLWLDKAIELILYRRRMFDISISQTINDHRYAKRFSQQPFTLDTSITLATGISKLNLSPARIDMGRLGSEWLKEGNNYADVDAFLQDKLKDLISAGEFSLKPKDVVLYGFGRIGRLAARVLISEAGKGQQLRLKAIVTRSNSDEDIFKRASLLRKDSVHGKINGYIEADVENKALIINGHIVKMIAASDPAQIDYTEYGIDNALIIDNTGVWRDRNGLSQHLKAKGVDKVLLTAPGKGDIPNIVHGCNHEKFDPASEQIWSAASCTTNAISPVLKVIDENFGIERGHIETVHSYTNDQNLLDNVHKKSRRGRSAPLNLVITETGAASAVRKVLPELTEDITGNAVRVPTPDVSLAILNLTLGKTASKEDVNDLLRTAASHGELSEQLGYSLSMELVSTDIIGDGHAAVIDSHATIGSTDNKSVVIYAWYDNEFGYTRQVIRLAKYLSNVIRLRYY